MKNQYFGDINDYRKYGLLRAILKRTELRLGVCWLLTNDDGRRDGEFRKYLQEPEDWCHYDPELYKKLRRLLEPDVKRTVLHAESWDLLPRAWYYSETVIGDALRRRSYFDEALRRLGNTDLLFIDPDNGLQLPSVKYGTKNSPKYLYWREVEEAYARGHSLIIYQHFPCKPRDEFVATKISELQGRLSGACVEWFRTAHVVFLAAFHPEHSAALRSAREFVSSRWRGEISVGDVGERPTWTNWDNRGGRPSVISMSATRHSPIGRASGLGQEPLWPIFLERVS